jgi:hypothetical protein
MKSKSFQHLCTSPRGSKDLIWTRLYVAGEVEEPREPASGGDPREPNFRDSMGISIDTVQPYVFQDGRVFVSGKVTLRSW